MYRYLESFHKKLEKYKGSLASVKTVEKIEANAKEHLNKLSKAGKISRICWGWYYIGAPSEIKDFWSFIKTDKNFKILAGQTAASFWNGDFIHRNVFRLVVNTRSFRRALAKFAKAQGWLVEIEFVKNAEKEIPYNWIDNVRVESPGQAIIDCIQDLAFTDAFAVLMECPEVYPVLVKQAYWMRVRGSEIRVRQVMQYGCSRLNMEKGKNLFGATPITVRDKFIKEEIDEAIARVVELG